MDRLTGSQFAGAMTTDNQHLIIGGTGKTGRRVLDRLTSRGHDVRALSRPEFDWEDPQTWSSAETGADSVYLTFAPEIAFSGSAEVVVEVARRVLDSGTRRLILLSGRGEPEAQRAEDLVVDLATAHGAEWGVARCAFFMQNFDEGVFAESLAAGEFAFPADDVREPFVDVDDVADVVTGLMLGEIPAGQVYELTGPRLVTFAEATAIIARAAERPIRYTPITLPEFVTELLGAGVPPSYSEALGELFGLVLDGHNEHLADGVRRALGREPRDLVTYARDAAASGCWAGVTAA
jgi:uncharacterized protein YbjT (DUF2867 family)